MASNNALPLFRSSALGLLGSWALMLPLLFAPPASAQRATAPTFGLQAPTSCTGALAGYTCTGSAQVTSYNPTYCGTDCHYEYCFSKTLSGTYAVCSTWHESLPASISLGTGLADGSTITIYSEYRFVEGETISVASQYGTASITLIDSVPAVAVNSPAGILGTNDSGGAALQTQLINGYVDQYVTYDAASTGGGTVNVTFEPCILSSSCGSPVSLPQTQFIGPPATYTWPSVWGWVDPGSVSYSYNYVYLTAQDDAGNTNNTGTPGSAQFTLFDGNTTTENIACSPTTPTPVPCTYLANGTGENGGTGDMPNDPPSGPDVDGNVFKGYADPTMRADTLVTSTNPNGNNLWMGYSWPLIQTFSYYNTTVGVVESHLALSSTADEANGGASWSAWCSGGGTCSSYTAIYPSVEHDSTTTTDRISSHEVLNLWPYIVQPGPANSYVGTETWYAAHLMYYRYHGDTLAQDIQTYGCLVVATTNASQNTQDYPGQLAWSSEPDTCSGTAPSNSVFLGWSMLNTLSGQSCTSWGEPAIMVSSDGGTIYLAAACFNGSFVGQGYWIFTVPTSEMTTTGDWTLFDESFSYSDLPSSLQTYLGGTLDYSYLMEFDWAIRADNTIVAVVTPAGNMTQKQFGCVVLNFTLASGTTTPFGSFWATVTDTDTSGPNSTTEVFSNGCTYEPRSNNGVVIVRYLTNSSSPKIQTYSIINTGLLP